MRTERDTLGEVAVPAERCWGAQTQRALQNFPIGNDRFPRTFLRAYALIKRAAAHANGMLGELPEPLAERIVRACDEMLAGDLDDEFPLVVWQSGSGTQTHMNVNEVIAHRANALADGSGEPPIHPNDHVNRGQSTNDTFPTAMHVACALALQEELRPALAGLIETLDERAGAFEDIVKIGRTHLQDATPLTVGQEVRSWASQLRLARDAIESSVPRLGQLAIGGTAVGSGLNAHPELGAEVARRLSEDTGFAFEVAADRFAALAGHEALVELSGGLNTLATSLLKIANDVRWLSSGPRSGLGELELPANEPGSSIMPGKVNPTQAEALAMVCSRVIGNHATVTVAATQGNLQLNVQKPVILHALLESLGLSSDAMRSFDERCVRGIEPQRARIAELVDGSLMLVTALTPHIGYDAAADIAKQALASGTTLREAAIASGRVDAEEFDAWVRPHDMIGRRK